MQIYVDILVQLHAEMIVVVDVKTDVVEAALVRIALDHVDLVATEDVQIYALMDAKQDAKIRVQMAVAHVLMLVQMHVLTVLIHADNRAALDARVVAKAAAKQTVPMTVLLIVLQRAAAPVLELTDLRVDQYKTLLQTTQEVKYL